MVVSLADVAKRMAKLAEVASAPHAVPQPVLKFNPGQARDSHGRWSDAGAMRQATDAERKERKVPPAWTDVHIANDPNAALQVVGKDTKGRSQYIYSSAHAEAAAQAKFTRLKAFNAELKQLTPRIQKDAYTSGPQQEPAAVLRLVQLTGFRVGSDRETQAKVKAYGASTLRAEHVKVDGSSVSFDFIGKKGVRIQKTITDPDMAKLLSPRVKRGGSVFATSDDKVRDYLHGIDGEFKVKDFRTWQGTAKALQTIATTPTPKTPKEYARAKADVGKTVAEHLGNTPVVALGAYIDPAVFRSWEAAVAG